MELNFHTIRKFVMQILLIHSYYSEHVFGSRHRAILANVV